MSLERSAELAVILLRVLEEAAGAITDAITLMDRAAGLADATGEPRVRWDMGSRLGRRIAGHADKTRKDLVAKLSVVEGDMEKVNEYIEVLLS